jgi:enterochelin esterase-like enzyme
MVKRLAFATVFAALVAPAFELAAGQASSSIFTVSFSPGARQEPVTGRVYVAVSRTNDRQPPIRQTSPTGTPLFGVDADQLKPGAEVGFAASTEGYPVATLGALPPGEYWIQPFVNVFTRFARADGKTVWLHMDQWEGQNWKTSPGNLYGDPVKVTIQPGMSAPIKLVADKVIPPIAPIADTAQVKRFKIQSGILSKWWGHPIYLGATVLLPRDYEKHPNQKYPVVYSHGHFSTAAPAGFDRDTAFQKYWMADDTPRVIYVTMQHPSPYYDDSYGVNSENNGPYGDAILKELIPEIETRFRVIREPWARVLTGGSTGGWIALALQVFHPDFYGGTFSLCPDGVDFRYHQIVNIYNDANAYFINNEWTRVERPNQRRPDGNIQSMMKDENWYELTVADKSRSGGQWDIWEATYSPVGSDGYPQRLWDKKTGVINKAVAEQWKKYDLREILEKNWTTLGPKISHKLHVYIGDMDSYYLNMGVRMLDEFLRERAKDPPFAGEVVFHPMAPHCWGPRGAELHQKMVNHIVKHAPAGADTKGWR